MKRNNLLTYLIDSVIVFICLMTLASCELREKKVEKVEALEKIEVPICQRTSEFGDGSFLSQAFGISVDGKFVFIADIKNNRIVVLDTQFSFIRAIGNKGSGPGEFEEIMHVKTYRDYIYAYDFSLRRISRFFKSGDYERIIMPKFSPGFTPFAFDDSGLLLFSTSENKKPIVVLSDSGTLVKEFGEMLPDYDGKTYPLRNKRFVFSTGNHIVALCESLPFIEKYDKDGNLLVRADLSLQYEEIETMRRKKEKKYRNLDEKQRGQVVHALFANADLKGKFLYASLYMKKEVNDREIIFCEILQIDVDSLRIKKVIVPVDEEKKEVYFMSMSKSDKAFYLGSDEIYKMYYEE